MATYRTAMEERSAWYREHHGRPGARHARISRSGARILAMLGPMPWDRDAALRIAPAPDRGTVPISWDPTYDERILGQASAPGFPKGDRREIEAGFAGGRTRARSNPYDVRARAVAKQCPICKVHFMSTPQRDAHLAKKHGSTGTGHPRTRRRLLGGGRTPTRATRRAR